MADEARNKPYIWATWLAGALSGDKHCEWSTWFRAHFTFDKRGDSGPPPNWKTDHDEAVRVRAAALRADGWEVLLEGQTKFNLNGATAIVGGQADILAFKDDQARVDDVKTGKRRPSDWWQVLIYMVMLPKIKGLKERFVGKTLTGYVVYRDGDLVVGPEVADKEAGRINARVREIGAGAEPARTPSVNECRFCDVASCPDRAVDTEPASGETQDF